MTATTLRELLAEHPEYADLPIGVYQGDSGEHHMLGGQGSVYIWGDDLSEDEIRDITEELGHPPELELVFSGN